ncbi:metal ABC transporter permease [Caldimonas tepidiphila]|uniref:metal ABC transporter permease n=1 Tax=Caldimonas tepidiphila TaxID=2315841 RepID=UPI000E5B8D1C|nr:metal ABC transporter permease [Caldimonas tepidiphila]
MNDISVLWVPWVTGFLVLMTHVPLGEQVLQRGIVFIDLAIAQVAALGVLMAGTLIDDHHWSWPAGSLAALGGAALVAWLSERWPERREALIGLVYIAAAAVAVLWVSADPHGHQKLSAMLAGDVLWVNWQDLLPLSIASVTVLLLQSFRPQLLSRTWAFYPCFAILVSLSVPLLGLYLVFASLIVPALSVAHRNGSSSRWLAVGLGSAGYALGLLASLWLDLPSGPSIVLTLMLTGLLTATGSPALAKQR